MRARVLRSAKRIFDCEIEETKVLVSAMGLATILKEDHIVVGDLVELEKTSTGDYQLTEVHPRTNEIFRRLPRVNAKKVIASNCDVMVIVTSISRPEFKRTLLDRYLVRAIQWEVPAIVVFNKMDEYSESLNIDLSAQEKWLNGLNVQCFEVSCTVENYQPRFLSKSLSDLRTLLKNKTAIVQGQSGVGKSKLITALSGHAIELKSGDLGKVGKGAHTTTWCEMVNAGEFFVIDSPGVRSFALDDLMSAELWDYFPDLVEVGRSCKYSHCAHDGNAKGCAFQNLSGENKDILLERLESYHKIKAEVEKRPDWEKSKSGRDRK